MLIILVLDLDLVRRVIRYYGISLVISLVIIR